MGVGKRSESGKYELRSSADLHEVVLPGAFKIQRSSLGSRIP